MGGDAEAEPIDAAIEDSLPDVTETAKTLAAAFMGAGASSVCFLSIVSGGV